MSKGKVLFIDDDNFLRKVYQTELAEKGFDVQLAVDGEDGLQKIAELHPDLIILDLIMPKKSGFDVLAELQRFAETRTIPVIVLSNLAQSDDQKRALDLGAVDYLVKDNTTLDVISQKIEYYLHTGVPAKTATQTSSSASLSDELKRRKAEKSTDAVPVPTEQTSAPQTVTDRGGHFCSSCGYKLKKGAKFCPDCGAKQE